ncbi:hypothetical protein [Flavobacterium panacagri]|uniref:hypothetical protein n=1 Tax=Flavobacterium panacagri TaxID=3034146 RepID=UPI0025A5329C|nr:hypothetical protein [Flavobacterium panacagri]
MKLIGVISEYNQELSKKKFSEYKTGIEYQNKETILTYLKNGIPIAVTMQIVRSLIKNDNSIIGGISYLTDGYWIWPNYLHFYVENLSIELPSDFVNFISKNREISYVSDAEKHKAINLLNLGK